MQIDHELSQISPFPKHTHAFNLPIHTLELQDKLLQAERDRDEALRKTNMERLRRRTLHNTLVVSNPFLSYRN